MKIYSEEEYPQGSLQWLLLRAGIPTASESDQLLTPKFKVRDGEMPKTYVAAKVAEKWQGGPLPSFSAFATEQGTILESADAVPWYELEYDCAVKRVGFITDDAGLCGCSPDGVIEDCIGLEVKCPQATNHVKYLLAGVVPEDYLPQVHFALYVTGFKEWRFLAYRRGFPPLVVTVKRDEEIQLAISEAMAKFSKAFDSAMARMTEINGGPPPRLKPMSTSMPHLTKTTVKLSDTPLCLQ